MVFSPHQKSINDQPNETVLPGQWLFYLVAGLGILISLTFWYAFTLQSSANLNHILKLQTEHIANDISTQLELRIAALKHMSRHLKPSDPDTDNNWKDIIEYINDYGGFEGIAWINSKFIIQSESSQNNEDLNKIYTEILANNAVGIANSASKQQMWFSSVVKLSSDEDGMVIATPLLNANKVLEGYLLSILNLDKTFNIHLNPADYFVSVFYDTQKVFDNGSVLTPSSIPPFATKMELYGTNWNINVQPTQHLINVIQNHSTTIALILTIAIALLFAIIVRLAQKAKQGAKIVELINKDLKKEITERRQAEDVKQKLEKALLQGQKLQAIGTLAGGIAHDFNNIIYAIKGYVEMAQEDLPPTSATQQNLSKVLEASQRGQELIARILAFSRRQHHEFKPINLQFSVESALSLLEPTIPASVTLNYLTALPPDFPVEGDPTRIHQVIVNIINNAVDSMDGEGSINIELTLISKNDPLLKEFPEIRDSNYCKIEISDTGRGMDSTIIERIFEPFYTTKEVGKGTGLGLSTVHTIIKEHHGEIYVTSRIGMGTQFVILLPEYYNIK